MEKCTILYFLVVKNSQILWSEYTNITSADSVGITITFFEFWIGASWARSQIEAELNKILFLSRKIQSKQKVKRKIKNYLATIELF